MKSICFVIEYSAMAHPDQRPAAKHWLKKIMVKIFSCCRSAKGGTPNNALNLKVAFLHEYSETGFALS